MHDSRRMACCLLSFPPRPALQAYFVPLLTVLAVVEGYVDHGQCAPPHRPSRDRVTQWAYAGQGQCPWLLCGCTNQGLSCKRVEDLGSVKISPGCLFFEVFPLYSSPLIPPASAITWHLVTLHPCTIPSFAVCSNRSCTRRPFWHAVPSFLLAKTYSVYLTNLIGSVNKVPVYFNIAPFLLGDGGTSKHSRLPCPSPVLRGFHCLGNTEGCTVLLARGIHFGHGHSSSTPVHLSSHFTRPVIPVFGSECSFLLVKKPTGTPGRK